MKKQFPTNTISTTWIKKVSVKPHQSVCDIKNYLFFFFCKSKITLYSAHLTPQLHWQIKYSCTNNDNYLSMNFMVLFVKLLNPTRLRWMPFSVLNGKAVAVNNNIDLALNTRLFRLFNTSVDTTLKWHRNLLPIHNKHLACLQSTAHWLYVY